MKARTTIFAVLLLVASLLTCADARTISFAGHLWDVRTGYGGPGPNHWSDSASDVWVDGNGWLHLKITNVGGTWYCAEVTAQGVAHYGMNRFYVESRLDQLDRNVVLALFLYKDDSHEIDIEFSKWGDPGSWFNSQYVVQPWYNSGNLHRFWMSLSGTYTTHYIDWHSSYINFKSIHGHYTEPPGPGYLIDEWTYTGSDIPSESDDLRVHINLWLASGNPPSDGNEVEVIIHDAEITDVGLSDFDAAGMSAYALAEWATSWEENNAGWNLYRSADGGKYVKLNGNLIPPYQYDYEYEDWNVESGVRYCYKLEAVDLDGSTQKFGPECVDFGSSSGDDGDSTDIPDVGSDDDTDGMTAAGGCGWFQ